METELKGVNGVGSLPLLKSDSSKFESSIEELDVKYAAFVRRDAYGVMGCGRVPLSERILLIIALLTIAPIRLLLSVIIILVYYLICRVCTAFSPSNTDSTEDYSQTSGWRRTVVVASGKLCSRLILFIVGVCWVHEKYTDEREKTNEAKRAGVIVSNHVSYLDILYHMSSSFPSFVAKKSVSKLPLIGIISKCLGCVFVQRESKTPNFKGVSEIVTQKVKNSYEGPSSPTMLLFPEGTTTNGNYLLPFKTGAFLAGVPVQPVILRYPYHRFSPAWESISGVRHLILLLCQFVNRIEVIWLPVYQPSKEEIEDARVYAENVRKLMAREGGMVTSDVGLAEKRIYHAALNGNFALHHKED